MTLKVFMGADHRPFLSSFNLADFIYSPDNATFLSVCAGVPPPLYLAIPVPASWCAGEHWIGMTWHFPCLCTRAVSCADQALPDRTCNSWCLESHPPGNVRTAQSG